MGAWRACGARHARRRDDGAPRVIAGTARVRAGRALIDGRAPAASRACRVRADRDPVFPMRCAWAGPRLAGRFRDEAARTAASRLAVLGLEALANRRVASLSSGESRCGLARDRAHLQRPVILVDEPLAGLNPSRPPRVVEALRAACGRGRGGGGDHARSATRRASPISSASCTRGVFDAFSCLARARGSCGREAVCRHRSRTVRARSRRSSRRSWTMRRSPRSIPRRLQAPDSVHPAVAVVVSGTVLLALARAVAAAAARTGRRWRPSSPRSCRSTRSAQHRRPATGRASITTATRDAAVRAVGFGAAGFGAAGRCRRARCRPDPPRREVPHDPCPRPCAGASSLPHATGVAAHRRVDGPRNLSLRSSLVRAARGAARIT